MITNLTVASNVPNVKEFLVKLNGTTLKFNKDFKQKEEFIKEISGGLLNIDTKIEAVNSETGIAFKRIIRTEANTIVENTQKHVVSSLSPDIVSLEVEFPLHLDIGVGYIKYSDGSSYYGLMKSGETKPFLMGIFTDPTGQETVKLDQGLEYGLTAFTISTKNLSELLQFLKAHVDKGFLSDIVYSLFIELTFKNDFIKIDDEISNINAKFLRKIALKTAETNVLLDSFIISIAKYATNQSELLFNLKNKDGSTTPFKEITLEQLQDLATTVADYYSQTNELIYNLEIVAKELPAQYHPSACKDLFTKLNLPQATKLYVNCLDKLATADFYIKTDTSSELKKINVNLEFSILSSSGRTGYTFETLDGFYEIFDQAQRWVGYYMSINLNDNYTLFIVNEPNVYTVAKKLFK